MERARRCLIMTTGQISTTMDLLIPRAQELACSRAHWSVTTRRRVQLGGRRWQSTCSQILIIGFHIAVGILANTHSSYAAISDIPDDHYLTAQSAMECRQAGGRWAPISRVPTTVMGCAKPTPDAGNFCHDNQDCATLCITVRNEKSVENICYGWSSAAGECLRLAKNPSREICFD